MPARSIGGLLDAVVTDCEGRVQPAPPVRSGVAFVAPVSLAVPRALRLLHVHRFFRLSLARCVCPAAVLRANQEGHRKAGGECLQE